MKKMIVLVLSLILLGSIAEAKILNVPQDFKEIQLAVDAAVDGDTVLIAPGIYNVNKNTKTIKKTEQVYEKIEIDEKPGVLVLDKEITIASHYLTIGKRKYIKETVLNGGAKIKKGKGWKKGGSVMTFHGKKMVTITGLTITEGNDGIACTAPIHITHCELRRTHDAIDFETGSGGYCAFNLFERNSDDGIDLDDDIDIVIEHNTIRDNDDDGIEIRLQAWTGHPLRVKIRNNVIIGNAEDGIQFISYNENTRRKYYLENNFFADNEIAAIAVMNDSNTVEDLRGAQIPEMIKIIGNTFVNNPVAICGGGNMKVKDNTIIGCSGPVLKNVGAKSKIKHNLVWNCPVDAENSNIKPMSLIKMEHHPEGRPGINSKWPKKN